MKMSDKKWVIALRLQTARKLKGLTEIIAGRKMSKEYIRYLERKLLEDD